MLFTDTKQTSDRPQCPFLEYQYVIKVWALYYCHEYSTCFLTQLQV